MKQCSNCRHYKRCTAASRQVVCNCYEEYGNRKEDEEIMNIEKVLVLHFPESNGDKLQFRGTCKMIDKIEVEHFTKKKATSDIKIYLKAESKCFIQKTASLTSGTAILVRFIMAR